MPTYLPIASRHVAMEVQVTLRPGGVLGAEYLISH